MAEAKDNEASEAVFKRINGSTSREQEEEHALYPKIFMLCFLFGTIILITFRILISSFELPELIENSKDIDFFILYEGFWQNGLLNFYNPVDLPDYIPDWPPYYFYHWYFIFFPVAIVPYEVGIYIWDILRLLTCSYISIKTPKCIKSGIDGKLLLMCVLIGFFIDGWFNNINFLILFFLFLSYISLESNKIWLSGIFFSLSLLKINSLIYIVVLLLTKKINRKNFVKFVIPTIILILPYLIFPEFFLSMINNWGFSDNRIQGLFLLDSITWKALQPSHLMFLSFCIIVFIVNLKNKKTRRILRVMIFVILGGYYIYLYFTAFFIPYGFI